MTTEIETDSIGLLFKNEKKGWLTAAMTARFNWSS